jgi:hypothetical protein
MKNKPLKILILTQIHPVNVAYVYDEICSEYMDINEVFSPQIMALLGELSLKTDENDNVHSYRVFNAAFVKNIKAAVKKMNPLKPWIFIGNCKKNDIKFDHIIGFDGGEDFGNSEVFDRYVAKDNELLINNNMEPINYYTKDDVEYFFPSMHHLKIFLDTLNIKRKEKENADTV